MDKKVQKRFKKYLKSRFDNLFNIISLLLSIFSALLLIIPLYSFSESNLISLYIFEYIIIVLLINIFILSVANLLKREHEFSQIVQISAFNLNIAFLLSFGLNLVIGLFEILNLFVEEKFSWERVVFAIISGIVFLKLFNMQMKAK